MAYGEGKSLLYKDIGQEQAFELGRYERELGGAEKAREEDIASSTLYSLVGSAIGATILGFEGGYEGAVKGWSWGGEGGKWTHRAVSGYDPEDYAISTDPGKFDVSQRFDFEDINRQFEEAERARFWKDVTGTGKTIAATLALGAKDEGSVWDYYSTENERSLLPLGRDVTSYKESTGMELLYNNPWLNRPVKIN